MTNRNTANIGVALRRFGLCGSLRDLALLQPDPLAGLLAQLDGVGNYSFLIQDDPLTTDAAIHLFAARRVEARQRRERLQAEIQARASGTPPPGTSGTEPSAPGLPDTGQLHERELARLLALAVSTPRPLEERLVLFWTNHFTVSAQRAQVAGMIGPFEREAVRPHILGRFEDLLLATALHPAMLRYLDNAASIGPNSPAGRGRGRSVNENLAREILELHTLGVDGGYDQADVTAFAKALSGWTAGIWTSAGSTTGTVFNPQHHEPGAQTILGRVYPDVGDGQAVAALRDLAQHPSTARHIARRLVQHFIGDKAPPAVAARLAETFRRTGGDLRRVTEALLHAPEAWSLPAAKLRSPLEFAMATGRVMGTALPARPLLRDLRAMGQPFFNANSPKGWSDEDNAWATPDGIKTRLDWSLQVAARATQRPDPRALAEQAFGPALAEATRLVIARAATLEQGLALLLMAPEMQRR